MQTALFAMQSDAMKCLMISIESAKHNAIVT